jgi:hypothetical protein
VGAPGVIVREVIKLDELIETVSKLLAEHLFPIATAKAAASDNYGHGRTVD